MKFIEVTNEAKL